MKIPAWLSGAVPNALICACGALAIAVIVLVANHAPAVAEEGWQTYANARFGTTAEVPRGWRAGRPPENGDGLVFASPDGQATITVSGGLHISDTIAEAIDLFETPGAGETITYKHREARVSVVSGLRGGTIFYARHMLSCGDLIWNSVQIEYPAARKTAFDPLVAHVAGSLRGGRSGQVPECNR